MNPEPAMMALAAAEFEDLHQKVWVRVWGHLPDGFRGGNFRAWLFQVAPAVTPPKFVIQRARVVNCLASRWGGGPIFSSWPLVLTA